MPSDDFNRADGALGANWAAPTGDTSTWAIASNMAVCLDDPGALGVYRRWAGTGADMGSPDHWSEVEIQSIQAQTDSNTGPAVRMRPAAHTSNQFVAKLSDSNQFWRIIAGAEAQIGSNFTAAVNLGDIVRLEAVGRTYRFKVNGTLVNLAQDTQITDGNYAGMNGFNGTASDEVRVNRWAAGLMTALAAPYVADFSVQVTGTGTTLAPTVPAQIAAGDLVLVHATSRDAAQTMTAPGSQGWSTVEAPSQTGLEDLLVGKIWGLGGQTDSTTPTFAIGSGVAGWGAVAYIIRNPAHATAPWTSVAAAVLASGSVANTSNATVTCPSVTHTGNNRTVLRLASSADDNALITPSTGFLFTGGANYDSTTGNDFAQAMSGLEDGTVTTNTGTSTFTESLVGPDVSNGITIVIGIPSTATSANAGGPTAAAAAGPVDAIVSPNAGGPTSAAAAGGIDAIVAPSPPGPTASAACARPSISTTTSTGGPTAATAGSTPAPSVAPHAGGPTGSASAPGATATTAAETNAVAGGPTATATPGAPSPAVAPNAGAGTVGAAGAPALVLVAVHAGSATAGAVAPGATADVDASTNANAGAGSVTADAPGSTPRVAPMPGAGTAGATAPGAAASTPPPPPTVSPIISVGTLTRTARAGALEGTVTGGGLARLILSVGDLTGETP